ncbi:Cell wall assembly/cell proliferation coordinating protein, KNR4-like protein [Pseudobacteroides cellulosolvens ATCC 35603 = DSM 2933]|uniref:Cell wall assembly/cell proliferation coordinating protein, KNR4-like protein n=1 Tax=Pseudobacteroides cellulosolvens ATCC 35603 = DSM 2933 TaxID=398512 RepID=A0A0L6JW91_9FIRM|nr:SMI1/KNR4 family protein [Pseudobacteroides cellulosolvens]KNY30131.1 Cell wall assembly/cell proliferation coordinating protein, KNR4-like protein [Pseudobacteroides cellulosolvens ATCC 35603 = DSM 2933]
MVEQKDKGSQGKIGGIAVNNYDNLLDKMELNPPCSNEIINEVEKNLKFCFPKDYLNFLLTGNGGEGWVGENSYLSLWKIDEIISLNEAYEINEFAPGLILFGSDGGLNAYAFDSRNESTIVEVPFIGMDLIEVKNCGSNFVEFLKFLNKSG